MLFITCKEHIKTRYKFICKVPFLTNNRQLFEQLKLIINVLRGECESESSI